MVTGEAHKARTVTAGVRRRIGEQCAPTFVNGDEWNQMATEERPKPESPFCALEGKPRVPPHAGLVRRFGTNGEPLGTYVARDQANMSKTLA
jgi:hypothetical protein